jgi:hypothetical protein
MAVNYKKIIVGNQLSFSRDDAYNYVLQTGTVAVTNGSTTVVGTGTTFTGLAAATLNIGGRVVVVNTVTDATHLDLTYPWAGPSASLLAWWKQTAVGVNFSTPPTTENQWTTIGDIEDCNITPARDEEEVFAPSPGHYILAAKLVKFTRLQFDFTLLDVSELFYEMLLTAVGPIAASYQPYTATGVINGWFRIKQFSQNDSQFNLLSAWGRAVAEATKFTNAATKGKVRLELLANPSNSGTLAVAAAG